MNFVKANIKATAASKETNIYWITNTVGEYKTQRYLPSWWNLLKKSLDFNFNLLGKTIFSTKTDKPLVDVKLTLRARVDLSGVGCGTE